MAIYVYETTDPARPRRRFELKQSMRDPALTRDPETGEEITRVISGGYGYAAKGGSSAQPALSPSGAGGSCGAGCGCH